MKSSKRTKSNLGAPEKPRNVLMIFLLLVCGLLVLSFVSSALFVQAFVVTDKDRFKAIQSLEDRYMAFHDTTDVWRTTSVPRDRKYLPMVVDTVWKRGEEVRKLLAQSHTVSPDTVAVWNNFQNFVATLQIGFQGQSVIRISGEPTEVDKIGLREQKQISFMPKEVADLYAKSSFYLKVFWRNDFGITVADIEWPPMFLSAVLYHELYHGMLHPVNSNSYFSPQSVEYAREEARAHAIESTVINSLTKGDYFKRFDEIIVRAGQKATAKDVVAAITIDDLRAFDYMIGMQSSGWIPASLAFPQHLMGLIVYFHEKRGVSIDQSAEMFMWLGKGQVVVSAR